jgi:integrase/recombinase XerD
MFWHAIARGTRGSETTAVGREAAMPTRQTRRAAVLEVGPEGRVVAQQPPLFELNREGALTPAVGVMPDLTSTASLEVARWWFRRSLETNGHPFNTVESYCYDLSLLQHHIGPKPVDRITPADIGSFLDQSHTRATRKRRLTSIGSFFDYLVKSAAVLRFDPSDGFVPEHIPLKTPNPLFNNEAEALLEAAARENTRTHVMIVLMLQMGISRGEMLTLRRDHIDLSEPARPVVHILYENPRWRGKERRLAAPAGFDVAYLAFLNDYQPLGPLFEMLPQSINKMVERVARAAGITKRVTPQLLRDTYAVNQARAGADEDKLLALLGLADDPRNRVSVQRYMKLAAPPLA